MDAFKFVYMGKDLAIAVKNKNQNYKPELWLGVKILVHTQFWLLFGSN